MKFANFFQIQILKRCACLKQFAFQLSLNLSVPSSACGIHFERFSIERNSSMSDSKIAQPVLMLEARC